MTRRTPRGARRRRTTTLAVGGLAALACVVPAGALGATAAVSGTTLNYDAAAGEFNATLVTRVSPTEYTIEDQVPIA